MKIQAFVKFLVEVEFEVSDEASQSDIMDIAEQKAVDNFHNAEVDDIEYYEN